MRQVLLDHGGDLGTALERYGGVLEDWLDLSTGINPRAYGLPPIPRRAWTSLPSRAQEAILIDTARRAYRTGRAASITLAAGAQRLIQLLPRLHTPGQCAIVAPTYGEHAFAFRMAGWKVQQIDSPEKADGVDVLVVTNPNNPDGRRWSPEFLLDLANRVTMLVVDESFADAEPHLSLASQAGRPGLAILRSMGKFYGLAGMRLGFALSDGETARRLRLLLGSWPVAGPAIEVGLAALADDAWAARTREHLAAGSRRLRDLLADHGLRPVGGTALFQLVQAPDATHLQDALARHRIWCRVFTYSDDWVRFGLPGDEAEWDRMETALTDVC